MPDYLRRIGSIIVSFSFYRPPYASYPPAGGAGDTAPPYAACGPGDILPPYAAWGPGELRPP